MQEIPWPLPGVDYPRTFQEFEAWFATEASCREYLARLRWPTGFRCPQCHSRDEPWVTVRGCLRCKGCRGDVSLIGGTLFEGTRKPLRDWYRAMWFVMSQKHGASALGLQRVLGLGSYQTAWTWLHKLRRAMVLPGRDRLSGTVEVDETFIGAPEEDVHGRETETKAIVVVAAENRGKAIGRIRLQRIEDASAERLTAFIQKSIEEGSLLITDGWSGYTGLEKLGYGHAIRNIQRSGLQAHQLLPRVHRVASLLKRWFLGTLQGGVQHRHLDYYLDEFTFRFNRRSSRSRGLLFYRLMQQAAICGPTPYHSLVGGRSRANHNISIQVVQNG
jgi:transposase-like protein